MLLVLTSSRDETADFLCPRLSRAGVDWVRLDSDRVTRECDVQGDARGLRLLVNGTSIRPRDVSNVWYRRPEAIRVRGGRDAGARTHAAAEWAAALEGFLALVPLPRWMNHPTANAQASHKIEQLVRARRLGLRAPRTLVTQDPEQAMRFWRSCRGHVVVKPVSDGRIAGRSERLVYTSAVSERDLEHLQDVRRCPTLFQERVQKSSDVRVTVVGQDMHAAMLVGPEPDEVDIRRNNMEGVRYFRTEIPRSTRQRVRALVTSYGLRFAALDFAVTGEGDWVFFEVNPNGQWAWLDLVGGFKIAQSFVREFQSE